MNITEIDSILSTVTIFAKDAQVGMIMQRGTCTYKIVRTNKVSNMIIVITDTDDEIVLSPYTTVSTWLSN